MTPAERAELYRDSADVILVVAGNGGKVPDGYRLESFHDSDGCHGWFMASEVSELRFYRLVELPKPKPTKYKPHTRATWPDYRYVKDYMGNAIPFGTVTDGGVEVRFRCGVQCRSWEELASCEASNHCNGPWEIAGVKE